MDFQLLILLGDCLFFFRKVDGRVNDRKTDFKQFDISVIIKIVTALGVYSYTEHFFTILP